MKPSSLRAIVLVAYVAGAALSVVVLSVVAAAVVSSHGGILFGMDVAGRAEHLAGMLLFDSEGIPVGFDDSEGDLASWLYDSLEHETAFRVLDSSGEVVLSSSAGSDFWPDRGKAQRLRRDSFEFERDGVPMRGATEPVDHEGRAWFLQFAVSERFMELMYQFALPFMGLGILAFSVVLLFVFGVSAFATLRFALNPLQKISDSAAAISTRALHARLDTQAVPSEIAPLVDSFNRVLGRLENGFRVQQDFLATAAHELKTPLALIRAQIEIMETSDHRAALLSDVGHMARQVQQLLLLAEASEIQSYRFAAVDLQETVMEAIRFLERAAQAADVTLVAPSNTAGPQWRADRGALFTLLKNLLENAIEHAPRGTEVQVAVSGRSVAVRDWGAGVTEEQLPQMFSRFWRGPHRRDHGAGLGLAICQEIALAHGWTLSAHRMDPGLQLFLSQPAPGG